ncbi:RNase H domain-containing protein [Trichonephila clavipes]|nr:RNase H domain-containing protein [Trichonephila clavipes]
MPCTSSSVSTVSTSSSFTQENLLPSPSAIIPAIQSESLLKIHIPTTTTTSPGNNLNTSVSSLETKTRSLTTPDKFNALSTETLPESVPTTSNIEHSNVPEIPQGVKRNSRNRRKRPKVQKPEIEIKMAPHRPRKSAPSELTTDDEDITYDMWRRRNLSQMLQLALERINNVPKDAVHMYTDGSKLCSDCSGSGIYISFRDQENKIQRKSPDSCSVFHSKLVAILEGLNSIDLLPQLYDIWIFSNSRSAFQHLANWHNVRDRTGTDILKILKRLPLYRQIHWKWIPSHVNIAGNEIAYSLARAGAGETTTPAAPLIYLELFSKYKAKNKAIWMIPPVHPWYQSKCPGGSLVRGSSRRD